MCKLIIDKNKAVVDQFWLTDLQTEAISDWPTADHVGLRHFAATLFSLLQQLSTVSHKSLYMADMNIFLSVN